MIALMTLLLATSCSQDDAISADNSKGNEATISLSIQLPDNGPITRAYGKADAVNQVLYEVYQLDKEGNIPEGATPVIKDSKEEAFTTTNEEGQKKETVTLSLLKGKSYKIAFWAQKKGTGYYNTDDLRAVKVNYTAANNDDGQDAFFKTEQFTVKSDASLNVVLNRPFAQINVGVSDMDLAKAASAGLTVTQSKAIIKNVANTINLIDGKVSGTEDVAIYTMAPTPKEENGEVLEVTINDEEVPYNYLSMSYLLVDEEKTLVTSGLEFEFANAEGSESVTLTQGLTNVPVQRNYRTNIIGRLLTSDIDFSIIIDELFKDEEYNEEDILVPAE